MTLREMPRLFSTAWRCALLACAALAMPPEAIAAEKINLKLGGFFTAAALGADQSDQNALRTESVVTTGEVFVQGWADIGDTWTAGFRAEIELERDNSGGDLALTDLQYDDDLVDEVWGFVQGPYGRLEFGQQDGVADQMGYVSPSVSQAVRISNPDILILECPIGPACTGIGSTRAFTPNGLQLRTDVHASEDYTKLNYMTPRIYGFQAGMSYTPELVRNFSGFATRQSGQVNQQSEIWEFALNYGDRIGAIDVGLSAVYLTGTNEAPVNFFGVGFEPDDVQEYGLGAIATWREWTLGGSFRSTNVLGGGRILNNHLTGFDTNVFSGSETEIWDAGLKYESGPWSAGLNYVRAHAELPGGAFKQSGEAFEIAGGVVLGPGIQLTAGFQRYDYEGPSGACNAAVCDTTDANVVFVETTLSF